MRTNEDFQIPEDLPTRLEHLAAMVKRNGDTKIKGVARPVVIRLPETTLAELDALATMAGKSRNSMTIHLLDVAMDELRRTLDPDTVGKLNLATVQNHVGLETNPADREEGEF